MAGDAIRRALQSAAAADPAERGAGMDARAAGAPETGEGDDLGAALAAELDLFGGGVVAPPKRGPGKPPGAVNRATADQVRAMRALGFRDPLLYLGSISTMDPRELAAKLKGAPVETVTFDQAFEVMKLQKAAAEAALPYWHQRTPALPPAAGEEAPRTVIVIGDRSAVNVVQHQQVSATAAKGSDGAGSDEGVISVEYQPVSGGEAHD